MFQINTPDAVAGLFVDGNPQTGQEGTTVPAAWLNMIQQTLLDPITHAGLAPSTADVTQLTQAIVAIATGVAGAGVGAGSVPTTRDVNTSGLITGGGALNADLTLNVPKATAAAILAGTDATDVITPDILAAGFGIANPAAAPPSELTFALPGGYMVKVGRWTSVVTAEASFAVNFVTPFPHACLFAPSVIPLNLSAANRDGWLQLVSKSAAGIVLMNQWDGQGSGPPTLDGVEYLCVGL